MTPSNKSFYDYLTSLAESSPQKKLLGNWEQWLAANEVLNRAEKLAARFQHKDICPGNYIALSAERNLNTALAILGLRLAGAVVILVDPREDVQDTLHNCDPPISAKAIVRGTDDLSPIRTGKFLPVQYSSRETARILYYEE